jgi:hypothetical protein
MPSADIQSAKHEEHISQTTPIEFGILVDVIESRPEDELSGVPGETSLNPTPNPRHLKGWRLYTLIFA